MGRKIPGKKHRGVKDPYEQQARRNEKLQKLINGPPSNPDDQDVPKSVLRLAKLKQLAKENNKSKKKKLKVTIQKTSEFKTKLPPGCTRPEKPLVPLQRFPGETDKHFIYRAHLACQEAIAEVQFENKYGVCVERDPETGAVINVKKRPKDEFDKFLEDRTKGKKKAKGQPVSNDGLSKKEKQKMKQKEKKLAKLGSKVDDFQKFKDDIKFGEVVHEPPTLSIPRKAVKTDSIARPGKKPLLLTNMFFSKNSSTKNSCATPSHISKLKAEERRRSVVEAYRQIKAQNRGR